MAAPAPRSLYAAFGRVCTQHYPLRRRTLRDALEARRHEILLGLSAVVADVTVAELGGFKAMNEVRPCWTAETADST